MTTKDNSLSLKGLAFIFSLFLFRTFLFAQPSEQNLFVKLVSDKVGCYPLEVKITLAGSTTDGVTNFVWECGDGTTVPIPVEQVSDIFSHIYYKPGKTTFTVNAVGVDIGTYSNSITVWVPDDMQGISGPSIICDSTGIFAESVVMMGPPNEDREVHWSFSDNTTITEALTGSISTVSHNFPAIADTYSVKVYSINQCGVSDTVETFVEVEPLKPLIFHTPSQVCKGDDIQFSNINDFPGLNYTWDFGDNTAEIYISNPVHKFLYPFTYNVTLTVVNPLNPEQCKRDTSMEVTVIDAPVADFAKSFNAMACDTLDVTFTNTTTGKADLYKWSFGQGDSLIGNPTAPITFFPANRYFITLTAIDIATSCNIKKTDTLDVPATPIAKFSVTQVCEGSEAQFTDNTILGYNLNEPWTYFWDFGDGETSIQQNPKKIFLSGGNQIVTFIAIAGHCSNKIVDTIPIDPKPVVSFLPNDTVGCPDIDINFTNNSSGAVSYKWNFNNTATSLATDTNYIFSNTSLTSNAVYKVSLTAYTISGCSDTDSIVITVYPALNADFTSNSNEMASCGPDTVLFTSITNGPAETSIKWDFGDGTSGSSINATRIYTNTNTYVRRYKVFLVATSLNGCVDTSDIQHITVNPKPRVNFTYDTIDICPPATFIFWAPPESVQKYTWDFGSGQRITVNNDKYSRVLDNQGISDTSYIVKLVSENDYGCIDSISDTLIIRGKPIADFTYNPTSPIQYPEATFNLTNNSLPITSTVKWNFGKGTDSITTFSPIVDYRTWGKFKIFLKAQNTSGCEDTISKMVEIMPPPPQIGINIDNSRGCPLTEINFTDNSLFTDTAANVWDFADGSSGYGRNIAHTYTQDGFFNAKLTTKDFNGNTLLIDTVIIIYKKPSANFTALPRTPILPDDSVYCFPLFPDTTEGEETYLWNFDDGETSHLKKAVHLYKDTGQFYISLTVWSVHQCKDSQRLVTPIEPKPGGKIVSPNAFMPLMTGPDDPEIKEGDVRNTVFAPVSEGVKDYKLEIFNRWGEKLFNSNNKNVGWNGYFQGKLCKQDVYVWKVSGTYTNKRNFVKTGTITLLHSKK